MLPPLFPASEWLPCCWITYSMVCNVQLQTELLGKPNLSVMGLLYPRSFQLWCKGLREHVSIIIRHTAIISNGNWHQVWPLYFQRCRLTPRPQACQANTFPLRYIRSSNYYFKVECPGLGFSLPFITVWPLNRIWLVEPACWKVSTTWKLYFLWGHTMI